MGGTKEIEHRKVIKIQRPKNERKLSPISLEDFVLNP